jgi:hypothetical protein
MTTSKSRVSLVVAGLLFSLLFAVAYAKGIRASRAMPLGIEIALKKPFYVPAANAGKTTKIVIRVASSDSSKEGVDTVSAIRLEPKMEGDKVRVTVFTLIGEPDDIRTCRDWDGLKSTPVGSYLVELDEEVSLVKLRDLGVNMGTDPLTFRVVPKRMLSPTPPQFSGLSGDCECASCGHTICCANPGACLGCGGCGYVCCSGGN